MKVIRLSSVVLSVLLSVNAVAADMFIKVSDSNGASRIVSCPSGVCTLNEVSSGSYQVQVCDEKGNAVSSSVSLSHSIKSPRDSASGLATGKRMHKPMTITKSLDKSSPQLFSLVVSETGSQVVIESSQEVSAPVAAPVSGGKVNVQDINITR
ncbi:MAG: hypothetical protein B0W54_13670 [Cellvibrio sp. 79]|nr:MAG: hypothetical protein B0W54_13670 [Cellvibrio sp. 79]